ncbi:hypothetical protein Enr10x_19310 [Gimesia panareensis]|uniref:4-O-methyl-glucuronoyl methylesterase-like domain-containing protein n=1 Tax=Gimesia panareensis TaxID=2527978 RepID=A0A517Q4Q7_9PLAN|nr:acetylxylan esterase [Gimesia panareensis]QDT26626.1 hypothetical protein Enr10x_19310 [Gimesia panareensis]
MISVLKKMIIVTLVFPALLSASLLAQESSQRLNPYDLRLYHDAAGKVQKVQTPADWQKRRQEIIRGMETVMGPFPGDDQRVPLNVEVIEEVKLEKYTRQLITYQSGPDSRTPAYLCIPHAASKDHKVPAVLCLHPTDNKVGHKVALGLGGRAGRNYGAELAERGYVTISPAYPHLANYWPNLGKLGFVSGTMKAIWDNSRAIDLLASLDYVDMSRGVGDIGHSLGGHNAIYTAVFDPRVTAIVSSCGFDSYPDYYDGAERVWYFGKGWCQIRYMPRMSDYRGKLDQIPFDFPELLGALSPRPVYVNAPLHDSNFRWKSVDKCAASAAPIYDLLGAKGKLVIDHPDCDHNFPEAQRQKAYQLFDTVLKK